MIDDDGDSKKKMLLMVVLLLLVGAAATVVAIKYMHGGKKALAKLTASPTLAVGDPRDKVIEILGKPMGDTRRDREEMLLYSSGRVYLTDGKVSSLEIGAIDRGHITSESKQIILKSGGQIQVQTGKDK